MLNALMRTLVPAIYGWAIHLGIAHGTTAPQWAVDLISLGLLAGVYLVLRVAEAHWRWVGVLLGWVGAPTYVDDKAQTIEGQAQAATSDELHDALGAVVRDVETIVAGHLGKQTAVLTAALAPTPLEQIAPAAKKPAAKKAPAKRVAKKATPK